MATPRGRTTNNFYPVCVVPDMFALNVSTQQASGGAYNIVQNHSDGRWLGCPHQSGMEKGLRSGDESY